MSRRRSSKEKPLAEGSSAQSSDAQQNLLEEKPGEAPNSTDAESRNRRAFFGRSGHLAVMAEFLHRCINVAIPEVDVGDDVFVVKASDDAVTRVQVKAATARDQAQSYAAQFNVPFEQLSAPQDNPALVYVFAVRYGGRWSDFIVIRRSTLFGIHTSGAGTRSIDDKGNEQVHFRIVFRPLSAWCGPKKAADLQAYRDAWEPWPPPRSSGRSVTSE